MLDASTAQADQSGVGVDAPTQTSCCGPLANPVLAIAWFTNAGLGEPRNTPTPPRITARGTIAAPGNAPMWAAEPYVQENPMRGLRSIRLGTRVFATAKSRRTSGSTAGWSRNRFASARSPYTI